MKKFETKFVGDTLHCYHPEGQWKRIMTKLPMGHVTDVGDTAGRLDDAVTKEDLKLSLQDKILLHEKERQLKEFLAVIDRDDTLLHNDLLEERYFGRCLNVAIENLMHHEIHICEINDNPLVYDHFSELLETYNPTHSFHYTIACSYSRGSKIPGECLEPKKSVDLSLISWNCDYEDETFSDYDILIAKNISSEKTVQSLQNVLRPDGYLLIIQRVLTSSTEKLFLKDNNRNPKLTIPELELLLEKYGLSTLLKFSSGRVGALYLLTPLQNVSSQVFITNFKNKALTSSIENVKSLLNLYEKDQPDSKIWIYADDKDSEIVELFESLRKEPGGERIQFVPTYSRMFNISEQYSTLMDVDLILNVYMHSKVKAFPHNFASPVYLTDSSTSPFDRRNLGCIGDLAMLGSKMDFGYRGYLCTIYYTTYGGIHKIYPYYPSKSKQLKKVTLLAYSGRGECGKKIFGLTLAEELEPIIETDQDFQWPMPLEWTLEHSITIPFVYLTAFYGLLIVGKLRADQVVLIHSGQEPIGQATIRIALYIGCRVFVTVDSEESVLMLKKIFPKLKDENFAYSHSEKFALHIVKHTNGKGVHMIVNSLSSDTLKYSFACLIYGGIFIQIVKPDEDVASILDTNMYKQMVRIISLDHLFNPIYHEEKLKLRQLIEDGIKNGVVIPIPETAFFEIPTKKEIITNGKHAGRVILKIREEELVKRAKCKRISYQNISPEVMYDPEKTYIIINGLEMFGFILANWLVIKGVKKLIITTKNDSITGRHLWLGLLWQNNGVQLNLWNYDVFKEDQCEQLLIEAGKIAPVGGIYNIAAIPEEYCIVGVGSKNIPDSNVEQAIAMIKNLDKYSRKHCPKLCRFIIISSVHLFESDRLSCAYDGIDSTIRMILAGRAHYGFPELVIRWDVVEEVDVEELPNNTLGNYQIDTIKDFLKSLNATEDENKKNSLPSFRYYKSDVSLANEPIYSFQF